MSIRSRIERRVRSQRARTAAAAAVIADVDRGTVAPTDVIGHTADEIIAGHNERYHPGHGCAENTRGQCLDAFGGERARGPLGEYGRLA